MPVTTFLVLDTPVPASVYYREPGPTIVMRVTDHVGNTKDNDNETVIRLLAFNSLHDPVPLNGTVSVTAVNGVVTFDDYQVRAVGWRVWVWTCGCLVCRFRLRPPALKLYNHLHFKK